MNALARRIAVVDDDIHVLRALQRLLSSSGYLVDVFGSGSEFMARQDFARFDCLVLDLHMPDVNGFKVQSMLSEIGCRLPTVVITGHDSEATFARAIGGGANAYLRKPVDASALLAAIELAIQDGHSSPGTPIRADRP